MTKSGNMIKFYYHYDKDYHQAKFVLQDGEDEIIFADRIICSVHTETKRSDNPPRFIVAGLCSAIQRDYINSTIYVL